MVSLAAGHPVRRKPHRLFRVVCAGVVSDARSEANRARRGGKKRLG